MIGYSRPIASWMEDGYKGWLPRDADPDRLYQQIGRALAEGGLVDLDYEESNIQLCHPERVCPRCETFDRIAVVLDTWTETRHRHCPNCGDLGSDEHVGPEVRGLYFERQRWRREGGIHG